MAVTQIGQRLVRTFGQGENLRKIVTEIVDGKTFTRVLDNEGKVMSNRVKQISRYNVGDKKVSEVVKVRGINYGDQGTKLHKTTYNRVYDESGNLLGTRTQFAQNNYVGDKLDNELVHYATSKQGTDGTRFVKHFNEDGIVESKSISTFYPGSPHSTFRSSPRVEYNVYGLPYPQHYAGSGNLTLKEMRDWHILNNPDLPYARGDFRLGFLDNRLDSNITMNNLDQFI